MKNAAYVIYRLILWGYVCNFLCLKVREYIVGEIKPAALARDESGLLHRRRRWVVTLLLSMAAACLGHVQKPQSLSPG
ncbi:protein of unknown function [Serratia sp. Tan611]|nr:protein of unknown function [Serratia sp. Tan611]